MTDQLRQISYDKGGPRGPPFALCAVGLCAQAVRLNPARVRAGITVTPPLTRVEASAGRRPPGRSGAPRVRFKQSPCRSAWFRFGPPFKAPRGWSSAGLFGRAPSGRRYSRRGPPWLVAELRARLNGRLQTTAGRKVGSARCIRQACPARLRTFVGLSGEGPTRLSAWWPAGVGEAITRPTRRPLHSVNHAAAQPGVRCSGRELRNVHVQRPDRGPRPDRPARNCAPGVAERPAHGSAWGARFRAGGWRPHTGPSPRWATSFASRRPATLSQTPPISAWSGWATPAARAAIGAGGGLWGGRDARPARLGD